jgi:hypothetical protein
MTDDDDDDDDDDEDDDDDDDNAFERSEREMLQVELMI